MATVSPFSLGCPHKPILARQPQTQTLASFPLSAQPEGSDSAWGSPVGMGALPATGLISATLLRLPSCQEQPSLTVCTTTASAWVTVMCLPAGRTTQDWKEPVCGWGSRRGSGWEERLAIAQCESRCLDSPSRYVGQVPSTLKLPSWAPITSLYLDWKGMASQDPSPGSHGRLGLQFPAELGLPDPWQCTLCRALAPIPHSQKSP